MRTSANQISRKSINALPRYDVIFYALQHCNRVLAMSEMSVRPFVCQRRGLWRNER